MSGLTTAEDKPQNYKPHPYFIRGFARVSKSGKALNISLKDETGETHILTISKADIFDSFNHSTQCCVIEFELSKEEKQEMKNNGS